MEKKAGDGSGSSSKEKELQKGVGHGATTRQKCGLSNTRLEIQACIFKSVYKYKLVFLHMFRNTTLYF